MTGKQYAVAAVVAAAGMSRRMGKPKQLLPWGEQTVLAAVVQNLTAAGAEPIVCVLGHMAHRMRVALRSTTAITVDNPAYLQGEMFTSFQVGIRHLSTDSRPANQRSTCVAGALLALADQPHLPVQVLQQLVVAARAQPEAILIPSYNRRRGHPIYLPNRLWPTLLALPASSTLRVLIQRNEDRIAYVNVDTPAVLRDMDTPYDYDARIAESNVSPNE